MSFEATCGRHCDPLFPDRVCKRELKINAEVPEDLARKHLKEWLLYGLEALPVDGPGVRHTHMNVPLRLGTIGIERSEQELDTAASNAAA